MSTEKIFGGWDSLPQNPDWLSQLWHYLAAQKVGTPLQQNNSGLSQRRPEITMLWSLFCRQKPNVIVEIGVAQGATLAGWTYLAPKDATIIAIDRDLNDCRPRQGEPVHEAVGNNERPAMTCNGGGVFRLAHQNQVIHAINGWSHEPHVISQLTEKLAGRKVDFCFHDASHSKEMFAVDFQLYWPFIADGGIMAVHDIQESKAPNCDKSVEWNRIKKEENYSACFEFLGAPTDDSLSIGCLIK